MIKAHEQRIKIIEVLKSCLLSSGWKHDKVPIDCFTYDAEKFRFQLSARFSDFTPSSYVTNYYILFKEVDTVFRKIRICPPGYLTWSDDNPVFTIFDNRLIQQYSPCSMGLTASEMEIYKGHYGLPLDSVEELNAWAESIEYYISNDGRLFLEEFQYLPNVLKKMDADFAEKGHWEMLWGSMLNGLVVSKLCDDKNYDEKQLYIEDQIFNTPYFYKRHPDWLIFWNEFKTKIAKIDAIYPYYQGIGF